MAQDPISALAPTGVLRAGINLGNPLLVTGRVANGDPEGVAPDMARALAERLGVEVAYRPYDSPGLLADAAGDWDVGLIAVEPARAEAIAFSAPYVEIEATYLVPHESPIRSVEEVDRPGIRIALSARSAYDLYLTRTIRHAELVRAQGLSAAAALYAEQGLDALAALRPGLVEDAEKYGGRVLDGRFYAVQQAIGVPKDRGPEAAAFVQDFVTGAVAGGFVAGLLEKHGVAGKLAVSRS